MLAEFVEKIVRLARDANKVHEIKNPSTHVTTHVFPDRPDIDVHEPIITHREYATLDSFIEAVKAVIPDCEPEILVSGDRIVCVCDGWNYTRLTMDTAHSMPVKVLEAEQSVTQHQLAKLIRKFLMGTGMEVLLTPLANVQFMRMEGVTGVTTKGRDSLGKSVESAVGNADAFPNQVEVVLSIFPESSGMAVPMRLMVNIEVRPTEQKFDVWINPDDMSTAIHQTLMHVIGKIKKGLNNDSVTVLMGKPV